jgi:putative phosphoesterase
MRIGLISDTHALVRPQAIAFLQGCDAILHAGDIVEPAILDVLGGMAPLTAVRGNNDHGPWADRLPVTATVRFGAVGVYVLHDIADLRRHPAPAGTRVVVTGHSHKPLVREEGGVLFVNPGSAGPRRFTLPISVGELRIDGDAVHAATVSIEA